MAGAAIREARERRGWTQVELAARVGRSQATISAIENGKANPPPFLLHRLDQVLFRDPREAASEVRETPLPYRLPEISVSERALSLPLDVSRWHRPDFSGDFLLLLPLPGDTLFLAAVDVAGHGQGVLPASLYLQGWLRGWLGNLTAPPRLQVMIQRLSKELRTTGVECGGYFALLSLQPTWRHTVALEALCCGFPPPLLLMGLPFRTLEPPAVGPPLPSEPSAMRPPQSIHLRAPWRLVVASDGLLARLGGGEESRGLRRLREWQTGPRRDEAPDHHLRTEAPPTDDELFAVIRWESWDLESVFSVSNDVDRHGTLNGIHATVAQALGTERADAFDQALVEALSNANLHGYGGRGGPVRVRFREEEEHYRAEVEDYGHDQVSKKTVSRPRSGFALMRAGTSAVDVRNGTEKGTVVTLVVENPGKVSEAKGRMS